MFKFTCCVVSVNQGSADANTKTNIFAVMIWCICGYHYKHFVSTATKGMGIMLKLWVPPTEPTVLSNGISSFFLEIHKMLKFTVCCLKFEAICFSPKLRSNLCSAVNCRQHASQVVNHAS